MQTTSSGEASSQLHPALSVYPKFWGHWAFIYSRYCSYSSQIHNDVQPTTPHVSEECKLLWCWWDIFLLLQRGNRTLGTKIMSVWLIHLYWRREVLSITTEWPDTSVNILRSQWKSCSSEQSFEGHKQPWNFESKGQKFYIIAFLTFLSKHFDQERVSFSKVNTGAHTNWIYDHRVHLQNLLRVAMRLSC